MPTDLPIPEDTRPNDRRRALLRFGANRGWWTYESENLPGHVDRSGRRYEALTYTIVRPHGPVQLRERVLLADEVEGYVLGYADVLSEVGVAEIAEKMAYRPELLRRE